MKSEYDAIHKAGFILQIDCPDLKGNQWINGELSTTGYIDLHIEALNHAVRDIPADRMRLHLCWGNYDGPHHKDVPLSRIVKSILRAKPAGLSLEGANPRHSHEWAVFREVRLPEDKVLIPGVIDSTTHYIEHPDLVAQRIEQYASVVRRERVIAGSDCGFATFASLNTIDPRIALAKIKSISEGAAIASAHLWRQHAAHNDDSRSTLP